MKTSLIVVFSSCLLGCVNINTGPADSEAIATTQEWAEEYARLAVMQHEKNMQIGCGFTGDKWHSKTKNHKAWALAVKKELSQQGLDERKEALDRCENASNYARRATEQHEENLALKCNLQGPIWHNKRASHFSWAESQSKETLKMHIGLRDEMLNECKKKK